MIATARPRAALRRLPVLCALALLLSAATASAQAPAGPPGPPPGNGESLPAPPGTAPTDVPPGTPAAVPAGAPGPGLLDATQATLNRARRTFSLRLACQASGTVTVTARAVGRGRLASGRYRCAANRATARLKVSKKAVRTLARKRMVAATARVSQAGRIARLSFTLRASGSAPSRAGFWTDGHLQCTDSAGGPQAYLVEPDFTTREQTPVSTRGWIAWHTAAGGWHWLGTDGENAGRWQTWTATPRGIEQFHPNATPQPIPWTWGPIAVPTGQGITTVGVFEIVYWVGGHPDYQWQYVNAGSTGAAAAGGGNLYCSY